MKKLSIVMFAAALSFSLAACKKGEGGDGASCDKVVAKMSDMMGKQMTGAIPPDKKAVADKMVNKIKEVMLASCNEDKWPAEVKTCVIEAKDEKALDACGDKGGKDFEDKMRKRMEPVMQEMMKEMMGAAAGAAAGAAEAAGAADPAAAGGEAAAKPAEGEGDEAEAAEKKAE